VMLELAHGPRTADGDQDPEERREIQRADFGYRALGTLMGRVGTGFGEGLDVPVFDARWVGGGRAIKLLGLPDDADWVELQNSRRRETVEVHRGRVEGGRFTDVYGEGHSRAKPPRLVRDDLTPEDAIEGGRSSDVYDQHRHEARPSWIVPTEFTPEDAIDSLLALAHRHGPVIALGPRIAPVQPPVPRRVR
jgi:hypothetical protein